MRPLILAALLATLPALAEAPSAEVKVGLAMDKLEITGASSAFQVPAGTRIHAWAKVTGCAGGKVTFVFLKGDRKAFAQELAVPRSPHRTNAYRTFRAGDAGAWTAQVLCDGQEIGKAEFKVELK